MGRGEGSPARLTRGNRWPRNNGTASTALSSTTLGVVGAQSIAMTLHTPSARAPRVQRGEVGLMPTPTPTHSFMLAVMRSMDFIVGIPLHARDRILVSLRLSQCE
jgi:hypothetical protein